jgi:hypothetical protein
VLAHYTRREPGVLDIFSEYSLKIPRICSNMLEYTRIYSIFPYWVGMEVLRARRAGAQTTLTWGKGDKKIMKLPLDL